MKNKTFAFFVSIMLGSFFSINSFFTKEITVLANFDENDGYGLPPVEDFNIEDYQQFADKFSTSSLSIQSSQYILSSSALIDLPSNFDLSTQKNFPPIGSQGSLGSCSSWTSTYYQFTYEAYKDTEIDVKEHPDLAYSPAWTFNLTNGGRNRGIFLYQAYEILEQYGALKVGDYPYQPASGEKANSNNFNFAWSNNTDAMVEALNERLVNFQAFEFYADSESVSENLEQIKSLLYGTNGEDGHPLAFSTLFSWKTKNGFDKDSNDYVGRVAYRCENELDEYGYVVSKGHSMTIVGYDDNIWCDINGNELKDEGEFGAFKVANSHDVGYGNSGYIWVAYDALNLETSVSGNWEQDLVYARRPIFYYEDDYTNYYDVKKNKLYWIEVGEKEVEYVGQLDIIQMLK